MTLTNYQRNRAYSVLALVHEGLPKDAKTNKYLEQRAQALAERSIIPKCPDPEEIENIEGQDLTIDQLILKDYPRLITKWSKIKKNGAQEYSNAFRGYIKDAIAAVNNFKPQANCACGKQASHMIIHYDHVARGTKSEHKEYDTQHPEWKCEDEQCHATRPQNSVVLPIAFHSLFKIPRFPKFMQQDLASKLRTVAGFKGRMTKQNAGRFIRQLIEQRH